MVIEYKAFQSRLPIRGVYVASPEIDEYLRDVEPPAHNTWDNTRSQQVDERAREVARGALARVRRSVQEFAEEFAPPPTDVPTDLPVFGNLLSGLMGGRGFGPLDPPGPGGHEGPLLTFRATKPDRRRRSVKGRSFSKRSLSLKIPDASRWTDVWLEVAIEASIAQDLQATASDPVNVEILPPESFTRVESNGSFSGKVGPGAEVVFTLTTAPFPDDRSLLILPKAELRALRPMSGEEDDMSTQEVTIKTSQRLLARPYKGIDSLSSALELTSLVIDGTSYPPGNVSLPARIPPDQIWQSRPVSRC